MALRIQRKKDNRVVKCVLHRVADIPGGVTVKVADLGGNALFEGTPLGKGANGVYQVVKTAQIVTAAAADATTYDVAKGHHFKVGDRFGRVILLRDYASYIKDSMVAEITDINRSMMLSIDVILVPTDEAVKEVEQRLLGVETNITNWQRKQNMKLAYIRLVCVATFAMCCHGLCHSSGIYNPDDYIDTFTVVVPELNVDSTFLEDIHNYMLEDTTEKYAQWEKSVHTNGDEKNPISIYCNVKNDSICVIDYSFDGWRARLSTGFTKYRGWLYWFNDMLPDGLMLGYSASPQVTRRFFVDNNKANYLTSHKFVYNYKKCKITSKWYREKRIY